MKTISIRELHLETGRWVRRAADSQAIIISDRGRPVATLAPYDAAATGVPLPDREARIRRRSRLTVDSAALVTAMRERA